MTKPQRVTLTLVPLISVGLLSWLPMLYLWVRDTGKRACLVMFLIMLVSTGILVSGLLTAEEGSDRAFAYSLLYMWMIVVASLLAWLESRPQVPPAKKTPQV